MKKLAFVFLFCAACTRQQEIQAVDSGLQVTLCVIEHQNEPPVEILKDCDGATAEGIAKVLTAERAARVRMDAGPFEAGIGK